MADAYPQPALFTPAAEVVSVTARWLHPQGWSLQVSVRRSGEEHWTTDTYSELSTIELEDVAIVSISNALARGQRY